MPISGPSSYILTLDEFLAHWAIADATLGAGSEIVLPVGVTRAILLAKKVTLVAKREELQTTLNMQETARGEIDILKITLLERIHQFNDKVRAYLPNSKWIAALPLMPSYSDGQGNFTEPLDDAATLWLQLNADPGAVAAFTLLEAYTQAMFATDLTALRTAYAALNTAGVTATVVRNERNSLQDEIYRLLKSYRIVLPTAFTRGHALTASLPRLTPLPGSTPAEVTVTVVWDAALEQARITWTATTSADLDHYDVRFCSGPNYSTDDESIVTTMPGDGNREVLTTAGLINPGATASFKVYVITTTDNEKGSTAVSLTRPDEA